MDLRTRLENEIEQELSAKRSISLDHLLQMIETGQAEEAADALIFFAAPSDLGQHLQTLTKMLDSRFAGGSAELRKRCLSFLSHLILGLNSLLPLWNLQNGELHANDALTGAEIKAEAQAHRHTLDEWESLAPSAANNLLREWQRHARARFTAEQAAEPEGLAERLVGASIGEYLDNMAAAVQQSHSAKMAELLLDGHGRTELGNDYAAFLKYTMYLGASFVTTNPVLVGIAWDADPDHWDPVMDELVSANSEAGPEALARLATLEVVLANMRLLRPIFLLTKGRMGCVSLQVNPKRHGDADGMIADATTIYQDLRARLDGGVPNVVFKLPGTIAGLEACRTLTAQGIGVNITVNFGLFQQLPFAEAIHEGQAIISTVTEMNGRLAYPVRDELLEKLPELAAHGISEGDAREAAAWSAVAVVKKLTGLLAAKGYDGNHIKTLVASLRIYKDGAGYERLPSPYPDITENLGVSIITVFPNVRHAFDLESEMELNPGQVVEPVPQRVLDVLAHSEIFKQAYYVADTSWVEQEDERFRPSNPLTLEKEKAVVAWPPIYDTLTQFADGYDRFVQRLLSRRGS